MTCVETSHYAESGDAHAQNGERPIRKIDFNQFSCLQIGIGGRKVGRGRKGMMVMSCTEKMPLLQRLVLSMRPPGMSGDDGREFAKNKASLSLFSSVIVERFLGLPRQ